MTERTMPKEPVAWLILFDDVDRKPEIFSGEGAKDAAHGGSHDTCFGFILREALAGRKE